MKHAESEIKVSISALADPNLNTMREAPPMTAARRVDSGNATVSLFARDGALITF